MPDLHVSLKALRAGHRERRRATVGAARSAAQDAVSSAVVSFLGGLKNMAPSDSAPLVVGAYAADDGEIDVEAIIDWCRGASVEIALPVLRPTPDSSTDHMAFRTWETGSPLAAGRFGLLEPEAGRDLAPSDLDAVITPLVAFKRSCDRVGRGGGFYDRTFGPLQTDPDRPILIGVAFEHQLDPELPVQDHDVPLDAVVTEVGIRWRAAQIS